jgi:hypothetical protein
MKIIRNDKLIRRNARIGGIATLGGLALLLGGMVFTFTIRNPSQVGWSWLLLIAGFIASQVGVYFGGRFGRSPRPDEQLDRALKGLDERYSIFHYTTAVSHLLVGPAGAWIFLPRHQSGKITYTKGRWRQSKSGCVQAYLRFFAQEGIGRPDLDIPVETQALQKFFQKNHADIEVPPIQTAVVFTHENVEVDADDAPAPSIPAKELKEFIRKKAKDAPLPMTKVKEIVAALEGNGLPTVQNEDSEQ